nr:hypothetical protein [Tanacetum cinerariifolium]
MVKSSSSSENKVFDDSLCSKSCKKNTDSLNTKITNLNEALSDSKTNLYHYKLALSQEVRDLIRTRRVLDIVLFPPPAQVYSLPKKDMSWTGLLEFADDTITDYSRPSPNIESNTSDLQNSNSFVFEHGKSSESIVSKPMIKFVKAARRFNTAASRPNVNSVRPKTTQDLVIIKLIQRVKRKQIRLKRDKSEQKRTKPDKNEKRVKAGKSLKQLQ